jgi:flavin-dependent dehydrogenase
MEVTVKIATPIVENLVIGGGLAGAMAAMRIAAAGCEVILLEKERTSHHKVCGEFLSPEAVDYLQHAGVDPLALGAAPIRDVRLSAGTRVVESELPFRALSLSRCVLDSALLAKAEEKGISVRRGAMVTALTRHENIWTSQLSDGSAPRAHTVFLATGKHDLRGWNRPAGRQNDLVGFKLHWRLKPSQTEALRGFMDLFMFPGGYGGLSLIEGDVANLCLVVQRSKLRKLGAWKELLAFLLAENAHLREKLNGAQPLWERPLAISSIPYGYLANHAGGAWCVGDQAAVIPSFTGDGMSIAMHSGALAAEMYLAGKTAEQYQKLLRAQLKDGMRLATMLSRAMVSFAGRELAPMGLKLLPRAISWIASSTRIPESALMHATPLSAN